MKQPTDPSDNNTETGTDSPDDQTPHGILLPKGVINGIDDVKNGDTATTEDIEDVLKF